MSGVHEIAPGEKGEGHLSFVRSWFSLRGKSSMFL